MTYSLNNDCTKNYYNRTLTVQVTVEDVVTWIFFETQCRYAQHCVYRMTQNKRLGNYILINVVVNVVVLCCIDNINTPCLKKIYRLFYRL